MNFFSPFRHLLVHLPIPKQFIRFKIKLLTVSYLGPGGSATIFYFMKNITTNNTIKNHLSHNLRHFNQHLTDHSQKPNKVSSDTTQKIQIHLSSLWDGLKSSGPQTSDPPSSGVNGHHKKVDVLGFFSICRLLRQLGVVKNTF